MNCEFDGCLYSGTIVTFDFKDQEIVKCLCDECLLQVANAALAAGIGFTKGLNW